MLAEVYIRALLAGVFFGIWPLFMNRSGLPGNASAMVFALGSGLLVAWFGIFELRATTVSIAWTMVLAACVTGAAGLVNFNTMLYKSTPQEVGSLFVTMIMVQIAVPLIYQIVIKK